jgi:hypothetical protein
VLIAGLRGLTRVHVTSRRAQVNGQPGVLFSDREGKLISVMIPRRRGGPDPERRLDHQPG